MAVYTSGNIFNYAVIDQMANDFLMNSLATEHINAHSGKKIIDVGFIDRSIVVLFEDMAQMTFEMIGSMRQITDPNAIVGSTFDNIRINNNYSVAEDMYISRVFISTRFVDKSSLLTVNYAIPLMTTVEKNVFPARIYTTYLNEVDQCHATQETTKKNTKPTMEPLPSVLRGQNETKPEDSLSKKAKSTKGTAKMSITSSPYQKGEVLLGRISESEMLQRIVPIPELPTLR